MSISSKARQKIDNLLTPKKVSINTAANDPSITMTVSTDVTPQLAEELRSALSFWRADDYEDWIRAANALHSLGNTGFEIWTTWAKQSSKFDEQEAATKWQQCPGERTGVGAIFAEAKRRGWVNPRHHQQKLLPQALLQVIIPKRALPSALLPVEILDMEILPEGIRPFIADASKRMSCQPDFLAIAVLSCVSGIIGRKACIAPKANDDWSVTPNLWAAIVGRPSAMKSPAISAATRPLNSLESIWQDQYESAQREHRVKEAFITANTKDRKKRMATAAKSGDLEAGLEILAEEDLEELPPAKRVIVNDATIEKLGELMNENANGLLLVRDELSGLIGSLMREDAITDRAFLLECYDGKNPFTFDRIGRGTVRIKSPLLSILGGIQPSRLSGLVRETNNGTGDDGLLQRFQLMVWPDDAQSWKYVDAAPDVIAYAQYSNLISELSQLPDHDSVNEQHDKPWRFSKSAQQLFIDWYSGIMQEARNGEHNSAFESHLIKSPKTCASLALIFELVDGNTTSGFVGEDATKRAIRMMRYLLSHAERIYGFGNGSIVSAAETIMRNATKIEQPFTMRDIARKGWSGINTENIQGALDLLIDYGHVTATATTPSVSGGRPTTFFKFVQGELS